MTLYYNLVFVLLILEMVAFLVLILPLPFGIRRKIFRWVSNSALMDKLRYGITPIFIFIAILFADAVIRMVKVEQEAQNTDSHTHDMRVDINARKFYAQRNMYLTGFTLFLSLILNRTHALILDLLASEEKLEITKKQASDQSKEHLRLSDSKSQLQNDIETFQKELEEKNRDFDILKKQAKQQSEEYQRMADEYSKLEKELKRRDGEVDKSK
uniref:Endoplasmic reticulum transmembrane protein n=1 Tax=Anthurium amnicola TaxID=1678845 RepID=A0A1D1YYX2_9ARAE